MVTLRSALTASLLATSAAALDPIVMKGSKFFTKSDGKQFYIKGVAYQQESGSGAGGESTGTKYKDPLADEASCKRDVPLLKNAGINTIRTYAINPDADHDACMKLLDDAGIYVIADLGEPALSINRDSPSWNIKLFDRYKGVIDNLGKYDNVIGFFSGNEVTNNATNTDASAFVKAATRDTKKYIADKQAKGGRGLYVGYAANDDSKIRANMAHYFNCGNEDEAIDFWGYNIYSWCGKSSFTQSGYDVQVDFFSNYSVPVFFAEYGCNSDGAEGRTWDDTTVLYSDQMTGVFSGGIGYMYFQEANDYGLVEINNGKATEMKNFKALATKLSKVDPTTIDMDKYQPSNSAAACPAVSDDWKVSEALPPTPDSDLCDCMFKSLSCVPGDDLAEKDFGEIFGYVCSQDEAACAGIKSDTASGVYGPYLMCNPKEQLGHILDAYYQNQNKASTACDFDGSAKVVSSPSVDSTCESRLASASSAVKFAASASAGAGASGPGSSNSDNENAGAHMVSFTTMGAVGVYVLAAMGAGAAMLI